MRKTIRFPCLVTSIVNRIYKVLPHNRKASQIILGAVMAYGGVMLSKWHCDFIHHYLTDYLGYALHGFGLARYSKRLQKRWELTYE